MKRTISYLAVVAFLALSLLSCRVFTGSPTGAISQPSAPSIVTVVVPIGTAGPPPPPVDLVSSQDTLVQLYEKVNPGVVAIRVLTESNDESLGSGFVYDRQGHIVTNFHVVESLSTLEVAFPSGLKVRGNVIGTDLDSDLAVVKVDAPEESLYPLPIGDSDQVKVGQTVVAIGNPFGYEGTMTLGIVSSLGRTIESLHQTAEGGFSVADVIQTDAAINPGNSGGPLLNLNGEVIGVNESIITSTGSRSNSGVGFAISSNIVRRVTPVLITSGSYEYPYLGITSLDDRNFTLLTQEALGLPRSTGVYVISVVSGSPADQAGLVGGREGNNIADIPGLRTGGDLIIAVDSQPVMNYNDLIGYLVKNRSPGDRVTLTVWRGNQEVLVDLTLGRRPSP